MIVSPLKRVGSSAILATVVTYRLAVIQGVCKNVTHCWEFAIKKAQLHVNYVQKKTVPAS
jgi:hypothetical protein